jgi:hypothetical protein
MANTYKLISSNVLLSNAANVTFENIPATFTDLTVRVSARSSTNSDNDLFYGRLNFDSTSIYSFTNLAALLGSISSARQQGSPLAFDRVLNGATSTENTFSNFELYIPSYTVSQSKPIGSFGVKAENTGGSPLILATASLYRNNAAINAITFFPGFGSFVSGSSFYLYGINNS